MLISTRVLACIGSQKASISKSKRKRSRKRKRDEGACYSKRDDSTASPKEEPSISTLCRKQILIGFNEVTRHLEGLSLLSVQRNGMSNEEMKDIKNSDLRHVAAVFLLRPMDGVIYSHLPTLCHRATFAHPKLPPTTLIILDQSAEREVAASVGHHNGLSVLAILDAGENNASIEALLAYVREHVKPVEVPWLHEAMNGNWLGTKVATQ